MPEAVVLPHHELALFRERLQHVALEQGVRSTTTRSNTTKLPLIRPCISCGFSTKHGRSAGP